MKYISLLLLLLLSMPSFSCDCKMVKDLMEVQKHEFTYSDLVFIGEVVHSDINSGTYQLKIVELFKGKSKSKFICVTAGTCSPLPEKEDGFWLVYANILDVGTIRVDGCGLSRSFRFPYTQSSESPVPPPPRPTKDLMMDELKGLIIESEYRNKALQVLKEEIELLRKGK
ncbi:hypothetical protein [Cesiribacter andamanensis]|uniref:Uncharacterized protein n=1 Tax=Cesiribacter andamanensis AMV16 TaxID=1279009 RepID=M7NRP8_9BACT|nr:hypothetical protein [Cesiribacter andamanensis]EMR01174.1 hypothetical protein ADICEAN_03699 [Cesiribacter andamanensis AMV16]